MSDDWWTEASGDQLRQGDLLPDCLMPLFVEDPTPKLDGAPHEIDVVRSRLIVVSQSCDLANKKITFVALCPVHSIAEFSSGNPRFENWSQWENVRKGRVDALPLLAGPGAPDDNRESYVVDFGHIVSVPFDYLAGHAASLDERWRLRSPFLEHFSQAFARFFMRVGLPSSIPTFR